MLNLRITRFIFFFFTGVAEVHYFDKILIAFKIHHFTSLFYYDKIKAVAISPSTAICPWNLFCRDHSRVFI